MWQCPIDLSLRGKEGKERLLGVIVICLFKHWIYLLPATSTHFNLPISNQTESQTASVGKDAKWCAVMPLMALRASERYTESKKRWQDNSKALVHCWDGVCMGHKEISRVSSLSESSLTAQIQSLWLNADDSVPVHMTCISVELPHDGLSSDYTRTKKGTN